MSPHALPYSRLNPSAPARLRRRLPSFVTIVALLVLLPLMVANGWFIAAALLQSDAQVTPVRGSEIHATDLGQLQAVARIDGYRAGVAAATESGCARTMVLSEPIAQR
jgi:hypothetical protein